MSTRVVAASSEFASYGRLSGSGHARYKDSFHHITAGRSRVSLRIDPRQADATCIVRHRWHLIEVDGREYPKAAAAHHCLVRGRIFLGVITFAGFEAGLVVLLGGEEVGEGQVAGVSRRRGHGFHDIRCNWRVLDRHEKLIQQWAVFRGTSSERGNDCRFNGRKWNRLPAWQQVGGLSCNVAIR